MARMRWIVGCAAFGLVAGGAAVWLVAGEASVAAARATAAQVLSLQAQANAACRCQRRHGTGSEEPACWGGFEREIARFEHSSTDTYCGEDSETWVCFGGSPFDETRGNCVQTHYRRGACDAEEARARPPGGSGCG